MILVLTSLDTSHAPRSNGPKFCSSMGMPCLSPNPYRLTTHSSSAKPQTCMHHCSFEPMHTPPAGPARLGPARRPRHHRLACIDPPPPPRQALLDSAPPGAPTIIDWHAGWAAACRADRAGLETLAARNPRMVFVRVDVEAGGANGALAREKVRGAHPCVGGLHAVGCMVLVRVDVWAGANGPVRTGARPGRGGGGPLSPGEFVRTGRSARRR